MTGITHMKLLSMTGALALAGCQQGSDAANQAAAQNTQGSASATGGERQTAAGGTIAESIGRSGDHSTLVQALKAAGIDKTLAGAGPYTVFAPTNAAFQKLPAGTAEALMRPEAKAALTGTLTYHIVPGVVMSKDLASAIQRGGGKTELATVGGGNLTIAQANGGLTITDARGGQARVSQADQMQSNGVVHSVDAVLMPREG